MNAIRALVPFVLFCGLTLVGGKATLFAGRIAAYWSGQVGHPPWHCCMQEL
jgi:hypothetical protein